MYINLYKKIVGIWCFLMCLGAAYSQTDTVFWFVAPEVCIGYNDGPNVNQDRPIRFVLSTYGLPATVTIEEPANNLFVPVIVNIPPNSSSIQDITNQITLVEHPTPNVVESKAIKITSTAPITAYYEVVSNGPNNPEIFSLKGTNAVGFRFYIPMQNLYDNSAGYPCPPVATFIIGATENNTQITITPTTDLVGHIAGVPFTVVLQAGESYMCESASQVGIQKPAGTYVESSRPVVITFHDDLLRPTPGCADQIGDQLVPITQIGTKYIVSKGFLNDLPSFNNHDVAFITATECKTDVVMNGVYLFSMDEGETREVNITQTSYLEASKPVYVLHISGHGCEIGASILPHVTCTGNDEVSVTRSSNQNFTLMLFTEAGNEAGFNTNFGNIINTGSFLPVPGTGGAYVALTQNFSTGQIPVGQNLRVSNTSGRFHMGMLNGNPGPSGCRYGYFSEFVSLNLGQDTIAVCQNDTLRLDAGPNKTNYLWSTGANSQVVELVNVNGWIFVNTMINGCAISDSVFVELITSPPSIQPVLEDIAICEFIPLNIPYTLFNVNRGNCINGFMATLDTSLQVSAPGIYIINAENVCGSLSDTIEVTTGLLPSIINMSSDTVLCADSIQISATALYADSFYWNTGSTEPDIYVSEPGVYIFTAENACGVDTGSVSIHYLELIPMDPMEVICHSDSVTIGYPDTWAMMNFSWSTGEVSPNITINTSGVYVMTFEYCNQWIQDTIKVIFIGDDSLYVPNVFTPNNDQENNYYSLGNTGIITSSFYFEVYNRWGTVVFATTDPDFIWNGETGNQWIVDGVYYYILHYEDVCGESQNKVGFISVFR